MQNEDKHRGGLQGKFEGFGAAPSDGLWESIAQNGSLADKFGDFGAAPSDGLWSSVEAELDEKKKRRAAIWWFSGAAAVVLLSFGIYQMTENSSPGLNQNDVVVAEESDENEISEENGQIHKGEQIVNSDDHAILDDQNESIETDHDVVEYQDQDNTKQRKNRLYNDFISSNDKADNLRPNDIAEKSNNKKNKEEQNIIDTDQNIDRRSNDIALLDKNDIEPIKTLRLDQLSTSAPDLKIQKPKEKTKSWELALDYSFWAPTFKGSLAKTATANDPLITAASDGNSFDAIDQGSSGYSQSESAETTPAEPPYPSYGNALKPINIALTVQRNVSKRWAFYGGLSYSRHWFKSYYSSSSSWEYSTSAVNAIGIPLGAKFSFVAKNDWNLYTRLGSYLDMPVFEKQKTVNATLYDSSPEIERNRSTGLMASVESSVGCDFELTHKLSVHSDFGLRWYYFQRVQNTAPLLRKDFWVGGSVGLSWEI